MTMTLWRVVSGSFTLFIALDRDKHDQLTPSTVQSLHDALKANYQLVNQTVIDVAERLGHVLIWTPPDAASAD